MQILCKGRSSHGHDVAVADALSVQDLRKRYGATEALKGVDLTVGEGELVGPARARTGPASRRW